jgi:hypothetical protein
MTDQPDTAVCQCGHDQRLHFGESAGCKECFCGGFKPQPATAVVPMVVVPAQLLRRCLEATFWAASRANESGPPGLLADMKQLHADLQDALLTE